MDYQPRAILLPIEIRVIDKTNAAAADTMDAAAEVPA
jgi:hypothetical protein